MSDRLGGGLAMNVAREFVHADRRPSWWRLGPKLLVHARGLILQEAVDTLFGQLALIEPAQHRAALTIEASPESRRGLRIMINSIPIVTLQEPRELAPSLEGILVQSTVRSRREHAAFHGSAVKIGSLTVMFAGAKACGKSTLAYGLSERGASYIADDACFVCYADTQIEAFAKAIAVNESGFSLFPAKTTHRDPLRGQLRYFRPRTVVAPGFRRPVDAIIFPTWSQDQGAASHSALSPRETARELVASAAGGLDRDPRMGALVQQLSDLPAYRLKYGDLEGAHAAIEEILWPLEPLC